jgi:hypothetical protein
VRVACSWSNDANGGELSWRGRGGAAGGNGGGELDLVQGLIRQTKEQEAIIREVET